MSAHLTILHLMPSRSPLQVHYLLANGDWRISADIRKNNWIYSSIFLPNISFLCLHRCHKLNLQLASVCGPLLRLHWRICTLGCRKDITTKYNQRGEGRRDIYCYENVRQLEFLSQWWIGLTSANLGKQKTSSGDAVRKLVHTPVPSERQKSSDVIVALRCGSGCPSDSCNTILTCSFKTFPSWSITKHVWN